MAGQTVFFATGMDHSPSNCPDPRFDRCHPSKPRKAENLKPLAVSWLTASFRGGIFRDNGSLEVIADLTTSGFPVRLNPVIHKEKCINQITEKERFP